MQELEAKGEPLFFQLLVISRLDRDLESQVQELADTAPCADLPEMDDEGASEAENAAMVSQDDLICMPSVMHLLTTYFAFNLIDLPGDFHRLVKQYYTRQCRGCRK